MWKIVIPNNTDCLFSPNGKYLAISGEETLIRLWEVKTWLELPCIKHDLQVASLAFSPDSQYLAAASFDKTSIWEITSRRELARLTFNTKIRAVTFSPDGKYLATGNADGTIQVHLWRTEELTREADTRLTRHLTQEEREQYLPNESYSKPY